MTYIFKCDCYRSQFNYKHHLKAHSIKVHGEQQKETQKAIAIAAGKTVQPKLWAMYRSFLTPVNHEMFGGRRTNRPRPKSRP